MCASLWSDTEVDNKCYMQEGCPNAPCDDPMGGDRWCIVNDPLNCIGMLDGEDYIFCNDETPIAKTCNEYSEKVICSKFGFLSVLFTFYAKDTYFFIYNIY